MGSLVAFPGKRHVPQSAGPNQAEIIPLPNQKQRQALNRHKRKMQALANAPAHEKQAWLLGILARKFHAWPK